MDATERGGVDVETMRRLNVLALIEEPDHYSARVRCQWPFQTLQSIGAVGYEQWSWRTAFGLSRRPRKEFIDAVKGCDVVFLCLLSSPEWGKMFPIFREAGKAIVVDMDDDLSCVSPFSESYQRWGTEECDIRTSSGTIPFWRDKGNVDDLVKAGRPAELGQGHVIDIERNKAEIETVFANARVADILTTTTKRAADRFSELNPRVRVLPNSLDMFAWRPGRYPLPGFRVGWHGGVSHLMDLKFAADALAEFARAHADVTVVTLGMRADELTQGMPQGQMEAYPWIHADAHLWRLRSMGLDLGICAVDPGTKFNTCKSPLKWTEFAALGVPTVCSDAVPYSDAVGPSEAFLTGPSKDEWRSALEEAYANPEGRAAVAKAARERVERDFDLLGNAPLWYEALDDAVKVAQRGRIVRVVA